MAFMELLPFPLLFLLLTSSSSYCRLTPNNNTDLSALLSFKSYVTDPTGILASRWTTNTSFCSWFGVSCSRRRQRVTSVDLHDVPLHGTISPHIANLSFLSFFYVGNCSLSGSIPGGISYLPRLAVLVLEFNSLSGYIPPAIFNMSSLESLYLGSNNLTGSIPVVVLPRLQRISLSTNHLIGEIPSSFARCKELQRLTLAVNMLTGTIPSELGSCPSLTMLLLGGNQLTGKIPSSTGNLSSLLYLDLSWNMLEGTIPGEWGSLSKLAYLHIDKNNLTGSIPISQAPPFFRCRAPRSEAEQRVVGREHGCACRRFRNCQTNARWKQINNVSNYSGHHRLYGSRVWINRKSLKRGRCIQLWNFAIRDFYTKEAH